MVTLKKESTMLSRLLYWITGFLPVRYINDGEHRYLERYYLFTLLGWQFYVHRFVGSDPDRGLHDHPWSRAFSIILSGWYWELKRTGTRKVRWFNTLSADTFHRVVLPTQVSQTYGHMEIPCWTLFFHRANSVKKWGFLKALEEGGSDIEYFTPYTYCLEGSQKEWWKTALSRRERAARATGKPS